MSALTVQREHPRAAECPVCGYRNDMPSECLRDDWVPQLCDHCWAPLVVRRRAGGTHPREDYDVLCQVDLDALLAGMSSGQVEAVRKLPRGPHEAQTRGQLGIGSSLRYLRDLWRAKRGILPPIILASSERYEDGKRRWWLSDLGVALRDHIEGLPKTRIRAHQVVGYRAGDDRNDAKATSHTYAMMADGGLWPMCGYGWNRSNGTHFSIFRGSPGTEGDCKLCCANVAAKRPPVMHGYPHNTRWL
jgi:hypothetical protein